MKPALKIFAVLSVIIGVLSGVIVFQNFPYKLRPESPNRSVEAVAPAKVTQVSAAAKPTIYRKSLIPGGIADVATLKLRVSQDAVLTELFKDFDWNRAHACTVPAGQFFVSYRVGDRIRWTGIPGSLEGKGCITDGNLTVLTRCGNLISYVPREPVGSETPNDLDMPESSPGDSLFAQRKNNQTVPSLLQPSIPMQPPTVENGPTTLVPIGFIPIILVPPATSVPTVQVAEPSTIDLLLIGLIVAAILYRGRQIARYRGRK